MKLSGYVIWLYLESLHDKLGVGGTGVKFDGMQIYVNVKQVEL